MLNAIAKTNESAQSDNTMMSLLLGSVIACLLNLVLVMTSPVFAAAVELMAY